MNKKLIKKSSPSHSKANVILYFCSKFSSPKSFLLTQIYITFVYNPLCILCACELMAKNERVVKLKMNQPFLCILIWNIITKWKFNENNMRKHFNSNFEIVRLRNSGVIVSIQKLSNRILE